MARINFAKNTFGDFIAFIAYNIIGNYHAILRVKVRSRKDMIIIFCVRSNGIIQRRYDLL